MKYPFTLEDFKKSIRKSMSIKHKLKAEEIDALMTEHRTMAEEHYCWNCSPGYTASEIIKFNNRLKRRI